MSEYKIRSPFFYMGDKFKLVEQLKKNFPKEINKFIEPFLGGGSVFLNIDANKYMLNDIDMHMIGLHKYLSKQKLNQSNFFTSIRKTIKKYGLSRSYEKDIVPEKLKKDFKKTYYARFNKKGYIELRKKLNSTKELNYQYLYLLLIYGFNRILRFNSNGKFNLPVGNVDFNKNTYNALIQYFKITKNKKIRYYNLDYKKFIKKITFEKNDFIYLDPPYLITASEYNKLWNEDSEKELYVLLDKLDAMNIKWALSNILEYKNIKNEILAKWCKKYKTVEIRSNYISFNDNSIKKFKEILVINYG